VIRIWALLLVVTWTNASADEWTMRLGSCYEWEGTWSVAQEPSGVWVGHIDFVQVGGKCAPRTDDRITMQARAAIVGRDFFFYRTTGSYLCNGYGQLRDEGVTGFEVCQNSTPNAFALRFNSPPR
jgi:hypothetical protein